MENPQQQPVTFAHPAPAPAPMVPPAQEPAPAPVPEKTEENWAAEIERAKTEAAPAAPAQQEQPQPVAPGPIKEEPKAPVASQPEVKADAPPKPTEDEPYLNPDIGTFRVEGNKPVEPTEEELKRAARVKPGTADDVSHIVSVPLGAEHDLEIAVAEITDKINDYKEKYGNDWLDEIRKDDETVKLIAWLRELEISSKNTLNTDNARFLLSMVDAVQRHNGRLVPLDSRAGLFRSAVNATPKQPGPKVLSGQAAIALLTNRYRGVYKVYLHNSGFHIRMMPLTNSEIDAWFQEVNFDKKELGRIIGGHFYLGGDVFAKRKLMEQVRLCTVESNLKDWEKGTTLQDNISIHDYDTLCWAFCSMMHPQGILFTTICPNCKSVSSEQYMDLTRMAYINPDIYTEEALAFVLSEKPVTPADLEFYRTNLLKTTGTIKITGSDYMTVRDPSIGRFVSIGYTLLSRLAARVKDGNLSMDSDQVTKFSLFQLNRMLTAWIDTLVLSNPGGPSEPIKDQEAIQHILPTLIENYPNVLTQMEEFMTNTKISYYLRINMKCPMCGHTLDLVKDNLYPVDMQELLFLLSYSKMARVGLL